MINSLKNLLNIMVKKTFQILSNILKDLSSWLKHLNSIKRMKKVFQMKIENKIPCIVCSKELDNLDYESRSTGNRIEVHPMCGLHFRTYGHYGSTIFDPMGTGEYLDVAICDYCVMKNLEKVRGNGKESLKNNVDIIVDAMERHG
jgi:hypothetical protein